MGWLKKHKKYSKPKKLHDAIRVEEENKLVERYGLKNKREIWKAESFVSRMRNRAKELITASTEKQQEFIVKLKKMGFKVEKIADILALTKEDWLKRRLQSVLIIKMGIKPKHARQLITHKHVAIDGKRINIPSYLVKVEEEDKIQLIQKAKPLKEEAK